MRCRPSTYFYRGADLIHFVASHVRSQTTTGIVSVSASDKGTGKAQNITIRSSGGLSKEEMSRMAEEAEQYAETDKKKRESIEVKNEAEVSSICCQIILSVL